MKEVKTTKETEYTVTIWTNDSTSYGFDNLAEASEKFRELKKLLKSNQKIEITKKEIQNYKLDLTINNK